MTERGELIFFFSRPASIWREWPCLVDPKAARSDAYLRSLIHFMAWKLGA